MFISNISEIMNKKGKTIRGISEEAGIALGTVHRATQDDTIGGCQLNTLGRIASALEVPVKDLFDGEHEAPRHDK